MKIVALKSSNLDLEVHLELLLHLIHSLLDEALLDDLLHQVESLL